MDPQDTLRRQYEAFPYPPVKILALPKRNQGKGLRYEMGCTLAWGKMRSHQGIRILVAGAGTLEALVVAQQHPEAEEIVAADYSSRSLDVLQKRVLYARLVRFGRGLPPVTFEQCDFAEDTQRLGTFDYVLATNFLHHLSRPAAVLKKLTQHLAPKGLLRVVTYPKASRLWMREAGRYLRSGGIDAFTPGLARKARRRIRELPSDHPARLTFESHPEIGEAAGIADAFLNPCENPLSPLDWEQAIHRAGLVCVGETQTATSRSSFLDEISPGLAGLGRWQKLQILDDLLELCANPILWLVKSDRSTDLAPPTAEHWITSQPAPLTSRLPSLTPEGMKELRECLTRLKSVIDSVGESAGVTLESLISDFRREVGPRVHPLDSRQTLPGLALSDYPTSELLSLVFPSSPSLQGDF